MLNSVKSPPKTETELAARCAAIAGLSLGQLASMLAVQIPSSPAARKGFAGQLLESALGADAGSKAEPDFRDLQIELKTLPLNQQGRPAESTFITTVPLLRVHKESWISSTCYAKLKRVLWLPIEADKNIPFMDRRIGSAILWSPSPEQAIALETDWLEITALIGQGQLESISSEIGQYLQLRPKAANSRALCHGYDAEGQRILTLPRGFYLRSQFTASILSAWR